MTDFRLACRTLLRAPAYSIAVVLTLALGIAGATAAGSLLDRVILRPLAWAPADRAMLLAERDSTGAIRLPSYPTFQDWRSGTDAFEAIAFARGLGSVLKSDGTAERLVGAFVTDEFFRVLPSPPAIGRRIEPADYRPGAEPVVVLAWHLWQRRFAADRSKLGSTVTLGDRSYTLIGVMPPGYLYPPWADFWAPIATILPTDAALSQRGLHVDSRVVGRLRAGVDSAAGERALSVVAARLADAYPAENRGWGRAAVIPVSAEVLGDTGSQLRLLAAAAALVLLVGCVNVAGLTLARAGARGRELAIRTALGGGRPALLRLLAAESLVLCAVAGVLGLGLAWLALGWVRVAARDQVPRLDEVAIVPGVLLAAMGVAALVTVALGLLPALRGAGSPAVTLREGAGAGRGPARRRFRAALVVGQMALALVLLTGTGLLVLSLGRLGQVPAGFDVDRLIAVPIDPPSPRYDAPDRALQLYRDVAAAIARVPGVTSVALTNHVPLSWASMDTALEVDGAPVGEGADRALFREVDTAYFATAGIPLLRGRNFTADDMASPGSSVIVNQSLAGRYWPGADPIGRRITVYKSAQGRPDFGQPIRATVVGVVANVRHFSLETDFQPEVYLPYTVTVWPRMAVLARTAGDTERLVPGIAQAVRGVDPDLPLEGARLVNRVYQLSASLSESLSYRRLVTILIGAFAVPAVLLAALGIYGVVAYLVTQRQREIAIRMAIGATPRTVLRLVLAEGMRLAAMGVALGVAAGLLVTRWLESQLYETSATDPATFIAAAAGLVVVALVATLVPARKATAIDPARMLQGE